MSNKKKLLVLTPRFPYPVIGGDRLRIYYVCKELSKHYDLDLLSLCESSDELTMPIPQDGVFQNIERILLPRWHSYLNCLLALPTRKPLQVAYYQSASFAKKLSEIAPKYDGVLAHLIRTGHYLTDLKKPKILEMTDAISMNYERVGSVAKSSGFKNIVFTVEQKRLRRFEKSIASKFDLSVLVSQIDKDYLFEKNSPIRDKVLVCSNGASLDALPYGYHSDQKTIVFIGNMTTVQNLDAAKWFAKQVMPKLLREGEFTFKIIGRIKDDVRNEFNKMSGVVATGSVDSVVDAAQGSFVGVCPMRLGAGVQNKVLEYMALGLPCITSTVGMEGFEAIPEQDLLIADTEQQYVDSLLKLKANQERCISLSQNGRSYVEKSHTWEGKLSPLIERIAKIIK